MKESRMISTWIFFSKSRSAINGTNNLREQNIAPNGTDNVPEGLNKIFLNDSRQSIFYGLEWHCMALLFKFGPYTVQEHALYSLKMDQLISE